MTQPPRPVDSDDFAAALATCAGLIRQQPKPAAQAALAKAQQAAPGTAAAWRALGTAFLEAGEKEAGAQALLRALVRSGEDPVLAQAAAAVRGNRLADAYPVLRDRLQEEPNDLAALRIMADVAVRMGRLAEASRMMARALELAPGFDGARHTLRDILFAMPLTDALAEIEQQLARTPAHLGYRNLKANLLDRSGEYDAAIALYRAMLADHPAEASIWLTLGHALQTIGRTDESIAAYRRSIALKPAGGEAWWSLANLKTFRFTPEEMTTLRGLLARREIGSEDRLHLEFALGKALEDAADYAASFAHYAEGNRLRRAQTPYHAAHFADQRARAARVFTPAFVAGLGQAGASAADPIFIVGMPRSGSTLVEQILASHPAIEGTMELHDLLHIVRQLDTPPPGRSGALYPEALAALSPDQRAALGDAYLRTTAIQRKTARPRFLDKLPANFLYIGLIRMILPNAKIIDVRRHPLACGFSCYRQHFARGHDFAYDLGEIGGHYAGYVRTMALWDAVLPGHVHRVIYERLVEDTESEVRGLLDYLGLPFDPACLRFHETQRAVRTPSAEQVRRPMFTEGLEHWRHFEPWLGPMKAALGDVLDCYPAVPAA